MLWPAAAGAVAIATLLVAPPRPGVAFVEDPAPGHTGGFGEPTCQACHADQALNDPRGTLRLEGVPDAVEPGSTHRLTVVLERPDLVRGGFQLTARFGGSERDAVAAGRFEPSDDRSRVTRVEESGLAYVHHSPEGTLAEEPENLRWQLDWTAPEEPAGRIDFHVAANASNDDDSELGDFIYSTVVSTAVQ